MTESRVTNSVSRPRILVTNDDGINADGLLALKQALEAIGDVFVVAPERPRSAIGHAVTLHKPLRLSQVTLADGSRAWASNGTPTDCVSLALDVVMQGRADLALAGINDGANLGWDLTYSGTVMAALEAAVLGVPTAAISLVDQGRKPRDFGPAAHFAQAVAKRLLEMKLPDASLLNVNVPDLPADQIKGVAVTRQGRREYIDRIVARCDPRGQEYYWLSGRLKDHPDDDDSDIAAINRGFISVTPIRIDMTDDRVLANLREWFATA